VPTLIPPRQTLGPLSRSAPRRAIRRFRTRRSILGGLALSLLAVFGVVGGADVLLYHAKLPSVEAFLRLPYTSYQADRPPRTTAPKPVAKVSTVVPMPKIAWRDSKAVGLPYAGSLVRGVQLPAVGPDWITFDSALRHSPSRGWRRNGTATLIHGILRLTAAYHRHTGHRLVIGDIARTNGGFFGSEYGGAGHASHQNGLDVDIYWPRTDGREIPPGNVAEIDLAEAQYFVDAAIRLMHPQLLVIGPNVRVHASGVAVEINAAHDDHMHIRIPNPG
jgi:hypothetical protein